MSTQTNPLPRFSTRSKRDADPVPERVDTLYPPEQASGPVPLRTERPVADILAERLAEADPASVFPSFIP